MAIPCFHSDMENYYVELPEGYEAVKVVDAKESKTSVLFTIGSLVLAIIVLLPILFNIEGGLSGFFQSVRQSKAPIFAWLVFLVSFIAYLVLHELTHGVAYKALTHQKLTFGFTLTVAFCGVPKIYVSRKTALISLAAPFVTFSLILIPLTIYLHSVNPVYFLFSGLLFACHFGGCVGDLYMMYLFLLKYRDPRTLMNDTGPRQTIYLPKESI